MPVGVKGGINAWLPVLGYCVLLFIQSSFASPQLLPTFSGMDKLLHFGAYAVLGLLFMRAFTLSASRIGTGRMIVYSILLTALYGISDEVHQFFVVVRTADMMDAIADALGGGCGVFLYYLSNRGIFANERDESREQG
jgi:VanZ family protein